MNQNQEPIYSLYAISYDGEIIYIGKTALSVNQRWSIHKCDARTEHKMTALHHYMNSVTTDKDYYSEFEISTLATTDNVLIANDLEKYFISKYNTIKNGYNRILSNAGCTPYKHLRPATQNGYTTR